MASKGAMKGHRRGFTEYYLFAPVKSYNSHLVVCQSKRGMVNSNELDQTNQTRAVMSKSVITITNMV